jgi:hypothetical protein
MNLDGFSMTVQKEAELPAIRAIIDRGKNRPTAFLEAGYFTARHPTKRRLVKSNETAMLKPLSLVSKMSREFQSVAYDFDRLTTV